MATQHDYAIADQAGAAFLADLNNALAAIVKVNEGATAPATTYAYMMWADTAAGFLKMRNAANSAWLFVRPLATPAVSILGHISGNALSNNVTDATNDIDIAAGACADATGVYGMVCGALTKRLDAAWAVGTNQGGLDTGAIANGTYHIWRIARSDTGVVDALFSTSATAPTMPANYDYKRRIGSIIRSGGAILAFVQDGDLFRLATAVEDVSVTNPGTAAVTRTLTVPTGINVLAQVTPYAFDTTPTAFAGLLSDLAATDQTPSGAIVNFRSYAITGGEGAVATLSVRTNTSAQIRSRITASGANTTLKIATFGWIDSRGK